MCKEKKITYDSDFHRDVVFSWKVLRLENIGSRLSASSWHNSKLRSSVIVVNAQIVPWGETRFVEEPGFSGNGLAGHLDIQFDILACFNRHIFHVGSIDFRRNCNSELVNLITDHKFFTVLIAGKIISFYLSTHHFCLWSEFRRSVRSACCCPLCYTRWYGKCTSCHRSNLESGLRACSQWALYPSAILYWNTSLYCWYYIFVVDCFERERVGKVKLKIVSLDESYPTIFI